MSICKWVRIFKVLSFSLLLSNLASRSNFDSRKIAQNSRNQEAVHAKMYFRKIPSVLFPRKLIPQIFKNDLYVLFNFDLSPTYSKFCPAFNIFRGSRRPKTIFKEWEPSIKFLFLTNLTRRLSEFFILTYATEIFQKWPVFRLFANIFHGLFF